MSEGETPKPPFSCPTRILNASYTQASQGKSIIGLPDAF